jgi:Xaa-Pro dipeptidase
MVRGARTGVERIARARTLMDQAGYDALLLVNSTNLLFLSGYPSVERTLARPHFLIVPRVGEPIFLVQAGRLEEARRLSWVLDVRSYDHLSVAPVAQLARAFDDLGLAAGRIGMELGFEQRLGMPVAELERLRSEFSRVTFDDASSLLWDLRMHKSPDDVRSLREACRITDEAYEVVFATVGVGVTDVRIAESMKSEMASRGGRDPWVNVAVGPGSYELTTSPGVGRVVEAGDLMFMDAGCSIDSLWSDYCRSGVVGGPSPEQAHAHATLAALTRQGVEMIRPGVPVADIATRINEKLHQTGLPVTTWLSDINGRIGHGIGFDVTEPPHISSQDRTILSAGMVISIEPSVATSYGLFSVEENVLVTARGYEVLSPPPMGLRRLPS